MIVKCRNREFDCKQSDLILDNGACYQIITKSYNKGWSHYTPMLAKSTFKKLLKEGYIRRSKRIYDPKNNNCVLYEFTEKSEETNEKK